MGIKAKEDDEEGMVETDAVGEKKIVIYTWYWSEGVGEKLHRRNTYTRPLDVGCTRL